MNTRQDNFEPLPASGLFVPIEDDSRYDLMPAARDELSRRLALLRDLADMPREFRDRAEDCVRHNRTAEGLAKSNAYHKSANRIEDVLTRHGWTNKAAHQPSRSEA